jgi:hypothetical protein
MLTLDISNTQMIAILTQLNTALVNVINNLVATGQTIGGLSHYNNWNSMGSKATTDAVNTLAQLYQRKLEAAPIQRHVAIKGDKGFKYTGQTKDGTRAGVWHGRGEGVWPQGHKYVGEWRLGNMHGQGTYVWSDSIKYVGEWHTGNMHGRGTMIRPGGWRYEGLWLNNLSVGPGKLTLRNGDIYEGDRFVDNRLQGKGKVTYASGRTWKGTFKHGQRADRFKK